MVRPLHSVFSRASARAFRAACIGLTVLFVLTTLTSPLTISGKAVASSGMNLYIPIIYSYSGASAPGVIYYVDCVNGKDTNSGMSASLAWRSMAKANSASLSPSDRLLFKRGCVWTNRLEANWVGTSTQPILIGAYGSGNLPVIKNGVNNGVMIGGSYLILENLEVRTDVLQTDPNCANQPSGYYQVGFNFLAGAAHDILRFSKASGNTAGVKIHFDAHHNRIMSNTLVNNNVESTLDPIPGNDIGAWGILVNGNDNEIAYNYFEGNNAWCSYDYGHQGNSVELYAAQRNNIHHNTSINDETFTELGGRPDRHSQDNQYSFNLFVSSTDRARFLIVSGAKDLTWGPTYGTILVNNTIYLTAPTSQGIICWAGCNKNILTLKNNIIWAEEKAAYADGAFKESNNIYWSTNGQPMVQFTGFAMSATSKLANPRFVYPANRNFHLLSTSPAINAGINANWLKDLDGNLVPSRGGYDLGGYELP